MKKVVYNITRYRKEELIKISGLGYITDTDLIIERHSELCFTVRLNVENVAEISRICTPAFRSLLVSKNFYEWVIIYGGRVSTHLKPRVEKVVLLVRLIGILFYLSVLKVVASLFTYLGYYYHTELKAACVGVVFNNLLAEPENVKVQNV